MIKTLPIFLLLFLFISCKNESNSDKSNTDLHSEKDDISLNKPEAACFQYVANKDTLFMQLEIDKEKVTGNLTYKYFEKDKNQGTFVGNIKGDTIFATYTFTSEGSTSIRDVVFLKKGTKLLEGFGEVEEINGKMKFKENTIFTFNKNMPFTKTTCN